MTEEIQISEKVFAKIGFPDAHVEVRIKVPIVGKVSVTIQADELDQVKEVMDKAIRIRDSK